jgi:3-oxoacyl-[acyl-carrier-protein] synthase II
VSGIPRGSDKGSDPFALVRRKVDVGPSLVSRVFDCRGPSMVIASACAAGGQAIGEAVSLHQIDVVDAAIAGGCEASLTYVGTLGVHSSQGVDRTVHVSPNGVSSIRAQAQRFRDLRGRRRPRSRGLAHARERGAPIPGRDAGYGDSTDAYRITDIHPQAEGACSQ